MKIKKQSAALWDKRMVTSAAPFTKLSLFWESWLSCSTFTATITATSCLRTHYIWSKLCSEWCFCGSVGRISCPSLSCSPSSYIPALLYTAVTLKLSETLIEEQNIFDFEMTDITSSPLCFLLLWVYKLLSPLLLLIFPCMWTLAGLNGGFKEILSLFLRGWNQSLYVYGGCFGSFTHVLTLNYCSCSQYD